MTTQKLGAQAVAGEAAAEAAALDLLLAVAALGPLRRLMPGRAGVELGTRLAGQPVVVARRMGSLAGSRC